MRKFGPAEKVYVENSWYDGPRQGVADINGAPHRFSSLFDEKGDEYLGTFLVWPIDKNSLALEIEQWEIFVAWNSLYEIGKAEVDSHPGNVGVDERWDAIELLLSSSRDAIPNDAKKARAEIERVEEADRYSRCGPDYKMRWLITG